MCSPSPPPPPDTAAAAAAQGAANVETAKQQAVSNNPNVNTPWDTRTVTFDENGHPTINYALGPGEGDIYGAGQKNRLAEALLAQQGLTAAQGIIGTPLSFNDMPGELNSFNPGALNGQVLAASALDENGLPKRGDVYQKPTDLPAMPADSQSIRNQVINAMMGRANIDIGKQEDQQNSDLIAAGIHPGTKAYEAARDSINREKVDALQQAQLAGSTAAAQAYGEDLSTRQQAQNEAIANNQASFGEQQTLRSQAAQEQAQRFGQKGQAAQLFQGQQAQGAAQSDALRRQAISELLAQREQPLNEISALMSGSQITNPVAGGMGGNGFQSSNIAPPPVFGAFQQGQQYQTDVYNQQVGTANSNTAAGVGAVAAIIAAYF